MNVLVLYKGSGRGGLMTNTKVLVKGLKERGINAILMGPDGIGRQSILKEFDVRIVNFSDKNLIGIYKQIVRAVKENNIDLIHAQNRIPALYASAVCFLHRNVKYVWANHQVPIPYDFFHRITTKYGERAITGCIDGFKMLTEKLKIPKEKVSIVNLGVDIDDFYPVSKEEQKLIRRRYGIEEEEKVILLYGGLDERKGHMFFMKSLAEVKNILPFKVIFPGDGTDAYKRQLIDYAKQIGIINQLVFTGFVDGRDILSISDLMVLPSKKEGFPVSCIEAFCMGVPVIRTKTGGFEDTKNFCTGIDYGDVYAFANELTAFFQGDRKFKEKKEEALKNRKLFSMDYMIDQYIKIYREILKADK